MRLDCESPHQCNITTCLTHSTPTAGLPALLGRVGSSDKAAALLPLVAATSSANSMGDVLFWLSCANSILVRMGPGFSRLVAGLEWSCSSFTVPKSAVRSYFGI